MHAVTEAQRRKGDDGCPWPFMLKIQRVEGKFVNRADCFITIHRKVQHPIPSKEKVTEFHVRKVRDVETGGEPTPLEEPIRFENEYIKDSLQGLQDSTRIVSSC